MKHRLFCYMPRGQGNDLANAFIEMCFL